MFFLVTRCLGPGDLESQDFSPGRQVDFFENEAHSFQWITLLVNVYIAMEHPNFS